jgi:hypothetical protein
VDLNLIASKQLRAVQARVYRLQEPLRMAAGAACSTLILPIDAAVQLRSAGGRVADLEPWDLAVLSAGSGDEPTLAPRTASAAALVFLATVS